LTALMRLPLPEVPGRDGEVDDLETPASTGCIPLLDDGLMEVSAVDTGLN